MTLEDLHKISIDRCLLTTCALYSFHKTAAPCRGSPYWAPAGYKEMTHLGFTAIVATLFAAVASFILLTVVVQLFTAASVIVLLFLVILALIAGFVAMMIG